MSDDDRAEPLCACVRLDPAHPFGTFCSPRWPAEPTAHRPPGLHPLESEVQGDAHAVGQWRVYPPKG